MKKYEKFVSVMILVIVAIVAGYNIYTSKTDVTLSNLILSNIEALAQSGEEGTSVGYCYIETRSSDSGYKIFCDSRTNNGQIYPCSKSETYGTYMESSKDRCTK